MKQPFFTAANQVINMYVLRQELASAKAPHSIAEIESACEMLRNIANAAAYVGSENAFAIKITADLWQRTEKQPDLLPVYEKVE